MSMPGLPPLPKSLSGFELAAVQQQLQYGLTAITEQAAAAAASQQQQQQQQLEGVNLQPGSEGPQSQQQQQQSVSPMPRKSSTLDTQLSILRREMVRERLKRGVDGGLIAWSRSIRDLVLGVKMLASDSQVVFEVDD